MKVGNSHFGKVGKNWMAGKHLLITGASSGLGRELAVRMTGVCRRLTLVARNRNGRLDQLLKELQHTHLTDSTVHEIRIDGHAFDVRDEARTVALLQRIYGEEHDQIDAFVNCAGGTHTFGLLENMSVHDIDEIVDVNAKSPMYWLKELLPRMKCNRLQQDDMKRGHVIMLSSRSGERALPNLSVYAAAKGCVEKLVEAVRAEYAAFRIAFTLVNPGSVNTAFTERWPAALRDAHNGESMSVEQAIEPVVEALGSQFAVNKISYESMQQWLGEPGVLVPQPLSIKEDERELARK